MLRELIEKRDPLLSHFYPPGKFSSGCCKPPEPPLVKPRGVATSPRPHSSLWCTCQCSRVEGEIKLLWMTPKVISHPPETAATNLLRPSLSSQYLPDILEKPWVLSCGFFIPSPHPSPGENRSCIMLWIMTPSLWPLLSNQTYTSAFFSLKNPFPRVLGGWPYKYIISRYAPPGLRISWDEHNLHLRCQGSSTITYTCICH